MAGNRPFIETIYLSAETNRNKVQGTITEQCFPCETCWAKEERANDKINK